MSFYPKISYPIGGKLVQGGLPTANQQLQFNAVTNQWEFVTPAGGGQTFARVVKKTNEGRASDIVMTNDAELLMTLTRNPLRDSLYGFFMHIFLISNATADFKYDFNPGNAADMDYTFGALDSSVAAAVRSAGTDAVIATNGGEQSITIVGDVRVASNLDALINFRWAQNVSDPGTTFVLRGSYMVAWQELP